MTRYALDKDSPWSYLRGFQPSSLCDWPGRIACVLFFGGCNLRCPTCHNAQLAWSPEELPPISPETVFSFLQARQDWLDGIVLSGGEPSQVPQFESLVSQIKATGMSVKLDTNGFKPEMIETLLSSALIDTVAVDLKGPWSKYPELTGMKCSEEQARSRLSSLLELAHKQPDAFYFRCTWVPQLTQSDIDETRSYLPPDWILHLQDYVPPVKKSQSEPSRELEDAG